MNTRLGGFCDRVVETGWILAVVLVPLILNIYAEYPGRVFEGTRVFFLRSITAVMVLAWIISIMESKTHGMQNGVHKNHPLIILVIVLAGFYLLSTLFSPYFPISLRGSYLRDEGFYTFSSYIIMFLLGVRSIKDETQLKNVVTAILITSIPVSVYAILQHIGIDPIRLAYVDRNRVTGTLGNPIFLGGYIIMVIPITISRFLIHLKSFALRASYFGIFTLQLTALWFTGSRGPQIGLVVGLTIYILATSAAWRSKRTFIALVVIIFSLVSIVGLAKFQGSQIEILNSNLRRYDFQTESAKEGVFARLEIWKSANLILADNKARWIVGYGLESLPFLYLKHYSVEFAKIEGDEDSIPDHSHNDALDLMISVGLPGLLLFMAIVVMATHTTLKSIGLLPTPVAHIAFFTSILIAVLVSVAVICRFTDTASFIVAGVSVGITIGIVLYLVICNLVMTFSNYSIPAHGIASERNTLLIGLLSATLCHFVEIQSGMGVTTTRLYFWCILALIVVLANFSNQSPPLKKNVPVPRGGPSYFLPLLCGLITATMSFYLFRVSSAPSTSMALLLSWCGTIVISGVISGSGTLRVSFLVLSALASVSFIVLYWILLEQGIGGRGCLTMFILWVVLNFAVLSSLVHRGRAVACSVGFTRCKADGVRFICYGLFGLALAAFVFRFNICTLYAEAEFKLGKRSGKVGDFEKAIELSPLTGYYYDSLSELYWDSGNQNESIAVLEQAGSLIPFDPDRIRVQARRYTVVKRWDDADTCYENLTSTFSPRNPHYFREWGDMLCSMGDFVSAKRKYEYAISIDPKSAIGFQSLGDLYVNKTDSMADAVRCFEEALSLGGQLNQSQIAVLCDAYFSSKRYRSFLNTSEMLLAYGPVDFPFHLRRSEAYYYLKEFDLALGEAVRSMSVADFGQIESASDLIQRIEDQIRKMTVDH